MDEAWCDVIPMTVYHMLLGRLWLYDRKVLYDGCNAQVFFLKGNLGNFNNDIKLIN